MHSEYDYGSGVEALVRAAATPLALAALRNALATTIPREGIVRTTSFRERADADLGRERLLLATSSSFALLALLLTGLGLLMRSVALRRREIGIRLALGAPRLAIANLVLGDVLRLAGWGRPPLLCSWPEAHTRLQNVHAPWPCPAPSSSRSAEPLKGLGRREPTRGEIELAVRQALGASRANLLRLQASEGLLLALAGAALALLLAHAITPTLLTTCPLPLPVLGRANGWEVTAFVFAAALAACGLFAVLPALHTVRRSATAGLPGRGDAGVNRSQARVGRRLLIGQVGLATVLLSAAGLLLGAFLKLQATSPGFEPQRLTAAQVTLKGPSYATTQANTHFVEKVLAQLDHAPGVSRAAAIDGLPLDRGLNTGMMPSDRPALRQTVELRPVAPGYFQTLGLQLLTGRFLQESDRAGAPPVAVISEAAACAARELPGKGQRQPPRKQPSRAGRTWRAQQGGRSLRAQEQALVQAEKPKGREPPPVWGSEQGGEHVRDQALNEERHGEEQAPWSTDDSACAQRWLKQQIEALRRARTAKMAHSPDARTAAAWARKCWGKGTGRSATAGNASLVCTHFPLGVLRPGPRHSCYLAGKEAAQQLEPGYHGYHFWGDESSSSHFEALWFATLSIRGNRVISS